jgi:putative transposase
MEYAPRRKLTREFKLEAVRHTRPARVSLFDYMEVFYNRQRRHSSISYEAPLPFEAMKSPGKVSTVRG